MHGFYMLGCNLCPAVLAGSPCRRIARRKGIFRGNLHRIARTARAGFFREAVVAAEDAVVHFDSVTDHGTPTVLAARRQCVDGTFEAVECPFLVLDDHLERLVIVVPAHLALHRITFRCR